MTGDTPLEPSTRTPSLTIATITAGSCRMEFTASLITSQSAWSTFIPVSSGPYLDMGRNEAVKKYRVASNDDFLLFVDTDIQFTAEDIWALVDAATEVHGETGVWPVVAGLYLGVVAHGRHRNVIAYKLGDDQLLYPFSIDEVDGVDQDSLIDVDAIGTGFMLIHRSTIEHFTEHFEEPQVWFYEGAINGNWMGEDLIFCLRAKSLGHPVLAHPRVRLTHYKEVGLAFDPSPDPGDTR